MPITTSKSPRWRGTADERRRLVRDWERPVYDLALRMLGHEADAADATQEIFAALFRGLHALDGRRDPRPWIYRVATNVLCNVIRDRTLRRRKERQAAMKDQAGRRSGDADPELSGVLREQLARLPDEARSLIVLHFYHGLTQQQVARSVGIARSTVQSRLKAALAELRRGLAASGCVAAWPDVSLAMRTAALAEVPPGLSQSLMSIAAQAGTSTVTVAGGLVGGVIMTKQIVVGAVLAGAVMLGAGFWAGRVVAGSDPEDSLPVDGAATRAVRSQLEELERAHDRTLAELRESREKARRAELALARRQEGAGSAPGPDIGTPDASDGGDPPAAPPTGPTAIDWERLGELFAANVDLLALLKEGDEDPTPEQQRALGAFFAEVMKIGGAARELSEHPFHDERVLPGLVKALFGRSLSMTESQLAQLEADTMRHLRAADRALADDALAIERYRERRSLGRNITASIADSLDEQQRQRWDRVSGVAGELMEGDRAVSEFGLTGKGVPEQVLRDIERQWTRAYGLEDGQQGYARELADGLARDAADLLRRYGQYGPDPDPLGPATRRELDAAMLDLQVRAERSLQPRLRLEQRRRGRRGKPRLLRFRWGKESNVMEQSAGGF